MKALDNILSRIPLFVGLYGWADPFADANAEDSGAGSKEYVHVRIQQRNGRKSLTTVQGLKKEFSYNKILKDLKKEFCCNGTVVQDPELGQVCFHSLLNPNYNFCCTIRPMIFMLVYMVDTKDFLNSFLS